MGRAIASAAAIGRRGNFLDRGRLNSNLGDELTANSFPASSASSNAPTAPAAD
jgi:hypothetical protein